MEGEGRRGNAWKISCRNNFDFTLCVYVCARARSWMCRNSSGLLNLIYSIQIVWRPNFCSAATCRLIRLPHRRCLSTCELWILHFFLFLHEKVLRRRVQRIITHIHILLLLLFRICLGAATFRVLKIIFLTFVLTVGTYTLKYANFKWICHCMRQTNDYYSSILFVRAMRCVTVRESHVASQWIKQNKIQSNVCAVCA